MFRIDNHIAPFMITVTLLTVIFIFFLCVVLIMLKNRQNRKSKEYLKALSEEKERTMYLISLEVHDHITQMLNIARMNLRVLEDDASPDHFLLVHKIGSIIDTVIIDTENISHTLNTDYLKQKGLLLSLQEEMEWVNVSKKMDCCLEIEGTARKLLPQSELMIFRIAQEAISNVIKYAKAQHVIIRLYYTATGFTMTITDDGKGFSYETGTGKEGIGMLSMHQRASLVAGCLTISSGPGKGTAIKLQIPVC